MKQYALLLLATSIAGINAALIKSDAYNKISYQAPVGTSVDALDNALGKLTADINWLNKYADGNEIMISLPSLNASVTVKFDQLEDIVMSYMDNLYDDMCEKYVGTSQFHKPLRGCTETRNVRAKQKKLRKHLELLNHCHNSSSFKTISVGALAAAVIAYAQYQGHTATGVAAQ